MAKPTLYASKVSVPLPDDAEIKRLIGATYDPAKTLNIVKMLAGTEDLFQPIAGLVKAIFAAEGIDPKIRQIIILRAASVLNVPYEWQANVPMSLNNGLSAVEVEAAANDGPVTGIHSDYELVCQATDEMYQAGTLTDSVLQALLDRFGITSTRKLLLIISWFSLLSLFLNSCRVPMETSDKIGSKKTPLG